MNAHDILIKYTVTPSFADGYSVCVSLARAPMVHAYVEKLRWKQPTPHDLGGHKPVGYPRVVVAECDVQTLRETLTTTSVPVAPRGGTQVFDGDLCELYVESTGYWLTIRWGDRLPAELSPVVSVLEKYARQSLES